MMIPRSIPTLALALLLLGSGASCRESTGAGEAKSAAPVLLRVDGRSVTLAQFRASFAKTLPSDPSLTAEEKEDLRRSFLVQLIDRELALAEADRLGIALTPAEVEKAVAEVRRDYPTGALEAMLAERQMTLEQWQGELEEGLLMEKVFQEAVYSRVQVGEEEIADYYREHRSEFDRPAQVRARQIVVASEAEAQRLLGRLRQGEAFAEVAREHSLSPDADQGGDLGFFSRGEMPPEFDAVVFTLPVGRLSDLVKSEYGFHLFLVEERREAVRLPLEQVRAEIGRQLHAEREEQAYHQWLQGLRARAAIEVDWSLL